MTAGNSLPRSFWHVQSAAEEYRPLELDSLHADIDTVVRARVPNVTVTRNSLALWEGEKNVFSSFFFLFFSLEKINDSTTHIYTGYDTYLYGKTPVVTNKLNRAGVL